MKTTHTPGPWSAGVYVVTESMLERIKLGSLQHAVCTDHDAHKPTELLVALCGDEPGDDSASAADARLMAQAPALASLIVRMLPWFCPNPKAADCNISRDEILDILTKAGIYL